MNERSEQNSDNSTSRSSACYAGSRVLNPVPGVMVGAISPEARDLLDTIMDEYREHYNPEMHTSSPDDVYQFAYWLCRWSGLVKPA